MTFLDDWILPAVELLYMCTSPRGFHLLNCMKGDLHLSCLVGVKCCEFAELVVLRLHRHEILLLTSTEVFPSAFCDSLTRGYIVVQNTMPLPYQYASSILLIG